MSLSKQQKERLWSRAAGFLMFLHNYLQTDNFWGGSLPLPPPLFTHKSPKPKYVGPVAPPGQVGNISQAHTS